MRTFFLIFILSFALVQVCPMQAQTTAKKQFVDVLYLKDGTTVKGTIVYMVPKKQVSIKIKDRRTEQETVKTYPMSEIERMAKEDINAARTSQSTGSRPAANQRQRAESGTTGATMQPLAPGGGLNNPAKSEFNQPMMQAKTEMMQPVTQPVRTQVEQPTIVEGYSYLTQAKAGDVEADINDMYRRLSHTGSYWNRDIKGLRAMTEYAYVHGIGRKKSNHLGWGNSIGYQDNPHFFMGVGIQYNIPINKSEATLPIYLHPRINFIDGNVSPFVECKWGYSVSSAKGTFVNPSAGVTIALIGTSSIDIGIGYSYMDVKWKERDKITLVRAKKSAVYQGLNFKVTYAITFWKL
ncbi:hypothetical protein [Dysgonomonas sp. 25]|uniref:hypothetical protein n=1 Tax=Dysgonomonas sp. 25 TaxID=2302933 RepID=UPI0013D54E8E|nr:hypothetical protein [Dysgonomonas sp. 25]NDV67569.1 hypothetical protein [Dysgonomonas sp. 25]